MDYEAKLLKYVLRIQSIYRGRQTRKLFKAQLKKMKYRKCVINEVIKTEQDFVRDIELIVVQIIDPCIEKNILTQTEADEIFLNLKAILANNKLYLETIRQPYLNYTMYVQIFKDSVNLISNFNIYFEYCNGYSTASKFLAEQFKYNQSFIEFIQNIKRSNVLRGMNVDDYLVKPVQRLTKYPLLLKDLLKHTDFSHPDYQFIKESLEKFENMNEQNNKSMDRFMNRLRVQEIQAQFPGLNLMDSPDRLYRFEDAHTIIQNETDIPVLVYYLSDALVITQRSEDHDSKLIKVLFIDMQSFVKDQPDSKFFKNRFQVVGKEDTAQFVSQERVQKKASIKLIEQLFEEHRQNLKNKQGIKDKQILLDQQEEEIIIGYPVQVSVMGTEERNYQSFNKHTVYITEVRIHKIALKIFVRFSEILELQKEYSLRYPNINFPIFNASEWLNNHKTLVIERRSQLIEMFLQVVLQSVITRGPQILKALKLPLNFYNLPEEYRQQNQQVPQISLSSYNYKNQQNLRDSLSTLNVNIEKMKKSAGEVVNALKKARKEHTINISSFAQTQMGVNMHFPIQLDVRLMNLKVVRVGIAKDTRAAELVSAIAQDAQLKYSNDFRIYLIDSLNNARVIDDDEVIFDVMQEEEQIKQNVASKIFSHIEKFFFDIKKAVSRLEMRKYFNLQIDREEYDIKTDTHRMDLITNQIFQEVKQKYYNLSYKEYCHFAALYFITHSIKVQQKLLIDIIPLDLYKDVAPKKWLKLINEIYEAIQKQITIIKEENVQRSQINHRKSKDPLGPEEENQMLAQRVLLNSIKINHLYGMTLYYVELSPKTQKRFKDELKIAVYPNIYIGVTYQKLFFLTPLSKEVFKEFSLDNIEDIKSFPSQINFIYKKTNLHFKFNTYQSYEIKMILLDYQSLKQFNEDFTVGLQY